VRVEQLENVVAVIQHGSLRRAADRLHLSQPALSESVRTLERELGVTLLDRRRSGARISREGRDLLPSIVEVLEAVDRLRSASDDKERPSRLVRVGTVTAGTAPVLLPAVTALRESRPNAAVEIVSTQQAELFTGLAEGSLDLGLVNVLPGDDVPPELAAIELVRGRPVVCCPPDHSLAAREEITVTELRAQPFITMRAGYLMHRFSHRLFGGVLPPVSVSSDGADMGKMLVAEGLGVTVLPDYSLEGDPLVRAGVIVHRPIAGDTTSVALLCVHQAGRALSPAVRALQDELVLHAARRSRSEPTPDVGPRRHGREHGFVS
jgi:DNA-binding transcriptional LysR family regulator